MRQHNAEHAYAIARPYVRPSITRVDHRKVSFLLYKMTTDFLKQCL